MDNEMLFVRDDIGHDDVMGFDGHVGDDLDIPGCSNRGYSALSGQEAVIIGAKLFGNFLLIRKLLFQFDCRSL